MSALVKVIRGARAVLRECGRRLRTGEGSAWVCLRAAGENGAIRIANRLAVQIPQLCRRACPYCGWQGWEFLAIDCGHFVVPRAMCPVCRCQERHRMVHLYLNRPECDLRRVEGAVLHFAPEMHIHEILAQNPRISILSTDVNPQALSFLSGGARLVSDMQRLPLSGNSVHAIFCFHVLEHVPDDRVGIAELHRVLHPDGIAYIMVPFMLGWKETVEFGKPDPVQFDHVRGYSPDDFEPRLAPFAYEAVRPSDFLTAEQLEKYQIPNESQVLFRCTKSPGA